MTWNTLEGRGPYIELSSGRRWYVGDPDPADVCIEDIAHALSNLCRFGGHSRVFYSVAQHSVLCAQAAWGLGADAVFNVLMHDASEAYLVDLPRPVKLMLPDYKSLEILTEEAIALAFPGLRFPHPDYVKEIDNRMLNTEQIHLMPADHVPYLQDVQAFNNPASDFRSWSPARAAHAFMTMYHGYMGTHGWPKDRKDR